MSNLNFNKYKTLIIAIIIVIIVIILDIIFENYSKSSIEKVNKNIDMMSSLFEKNENVDDEKDSEDYDINKMKKFSENAKEEWKKREKILSCFIEHDEIEKINVKLDVLYTQVKDKNWVDSKSTVSEIKRLIKYLDGKYEFSIQNIF